ncbi:MAG TPA: glycosyltransferase [Gaiellaceae bacterium]|nr:glycosyltransferase [Gaiellaceae bacterium]
MGGDGRSRRLLFHSYHFPPIGGSGVQRPLKMVRALDRIGYESVVVTSSGATRDRWAPEDSGLLAEIPAHLEIRRVPGDEPGARTRWDGLAERWLGASGAWSRWWNEQSYRAAVDGGTDFDLIYVWMQPYASAETGAALSRDLEKPWIADLGDPWALDEMMVYPSSLHRRVAAKRMRELLRTASAIVMSTPEAARRLLAAFPDLGDRPVVVIPNGFDRADFAHPVSPRGDGKLRIVHTGYLHTALGEQHRQKRALRRVLGGSVHGLDILTRSHVHLVEALNRLITDDRSLEHVLDLHLAGVMTEADRAVVTTRCPVTLHGFMSHTDSVELMRSADLLFLPMQNLPPGTRATIVPGKTYEYLASGRPILAAVPDGDARDILGEAGNALLVRPDDVSGMSSAIRGQLDRFFAGTPSPPPDPAVVERFEYSTLAGDLANVFDLVLAGRQLQDGATNQP